MIGGGGFLVETVAGVDGDGGWASKNGRPVATDYQRPEALNGGTAPIFLLCGN